MDTLTLRGRRMSFCGIVPWEALEDSGWDLEGQAPSGGRGGGGRRSTESEFHPAPLLNSGHAQRMSTAGGL